MPAERTRELSESLWRHSDFRKLWAGQSVSTFGSMLTTIALPLTALLALDAGPLEQGILQAAAAAPVLAAGLMAGAYVDRRRRRPVMIAADVARAALLGAVPALAAAGLLRVWHLYAVAAGAALAGALFDAAYPAYLPSLVGRSRLVEANANLAAGASAVEAAAFVSAGALVQTVGGPVAVLVDAATFVASALSLAAIRMPEPAPDASHPSPPEPSLGAAREGLRYVATEPTLRALVGCATVQRFAGGVFAALYVLFAVRDLGLSPLLAGAVAGCGGLGSLAGAAAVGPALRRFGPKTTLVAGFVAGGALQGLVPAAAGPAWLVVAMLVTAQVVGDALLTTASIVDASLRQSIVPDRLLGRASATANALAAGALPAGALVGGLVGQIAGPRVALAAASVGLAAAALWIVGAPIPSEVGAPREAEPPIDPDSTTP